MNRILTATAMALTLGLSTLATPAEAEGNWPATKRVWDDYRPFGLTQKNWQDRTLLSGVFAAAPLTLLTAPLDALDMVLARPIIGGILAPALDLSGISVAPHAPQPDFAADHRACMETMKNHSRNGRVGKGTERYCNRLAAKGIRPTPWVTPKLFQ